MPTLYINEEMMEEVESVLNDGFHFITTLNTYDDNTTGLNACRQSSTIKIINIDRNVFGHILTGIRRKGSGPIKKI
ncbi:MAG: hypothetical protein SPL99_07460 [Catonella sp.]|nr:hypothetical protein [Catonella sp.]MDY6356274.1 hypothetical protein [Catonella sp.]